MAVTSDGQRAVSASIDRTLKVWDIASGRAITTFMGDTDIRCVATSDRDRIVAGDMLGRVHLLHLVR